MEVQNHGVLFEDSIIKSITGLSKDEYQDRLPNAYTASMDIVKGIQSDANYSVKVSKDGKSIGCGDILRFAHHCGTDEFTMIVGAWQQISPTIKRYNCIYEFHIRPKHYSILWDRITEDALKPFVDYVKAIPPGKSGQMAHQRLWKLKRSEIYSNFGQGLVRIDAKVDSKTQRRVQCSIKVEDLIKSKIEHVKYDNNYKGITLPYEQESSPRHFSRT